MFFMPRVQIDKAMKIEWLLGAHSLFHIDRTSKTPRDEFLDRPYI